jgi:hypothetical protein
LISFFIEGLGIGITMDKITTQGRFKEDTIAFDKVDFPDPELPAIPMIVTSAQGGE